MKKRGRHTPDQIVRKLRIADKLRAEGRDQAEIAKHLEVAEGTLYRWRNQYGGMRQATPSASRNSKTRSAS